jgi:hypothetical protein
LPRVPIIPPIPVIPIVQTPPVIPSRPSTPIPIITPIPITPVEVVPVTPIITPTRPIDTNILFTPILTPTPTRPTVVVPIVPSVPVVPVVPVVPPVVTPSIQYAFDYQFNITTYSSDRVTILSSRSVKTNTLSAREIKCFVQNTKAGNPLINVGNNGQFQFTTEAIKVGTTVYNSNGNGFVKTSLTGNLRVIASQISSTQNLGLTLGHTYVVNIQNGIVTELIDVATLPDCVTGVIS